MRTIIPLFPNPPNSPRLSQYVDSDGVQSDFPPIRIRDSTPDPLTPPATKRKSSCRLRSSVVQKNPERRSSPTQSEQSPRLPCPRPKTGLGDRNILNTIQVAVQQTKNVPLKRPPASDDVDRPLKRRCVRVDEDWLKHEIGDIKEQMTQLRADVDLRLGEILQEVRQFNEI